MSYVPSQLVRLLAAAVAVMVMSLCATSAQAVPLPAKTGNMKPLAVVRFNQPQVHYKKPLKGAVTRAMALKSGVRFNVVSYVPYTSDPELNKQYLMLANAHLRELTDNLIQMGVEIDRMVLSTELQPQIKFDEIHIYAR